MYLHIAQFFVVQHKCVPVADVGVSPVCPCRPPLHHGYGDGGNAGEVSNMRVLSLLSVFVDVLRCVSVADAGALLVRSCYPPLHLGDGAGMRVGELSNTNIQVLPHVNVQV